MNHKPTVITDNAWNESMRRMRHGLTMANLQRLRDGKQKTMKASKIYCYCDACSTLAENVADRLRS